MGGPPPVPGDRVGCAVPCPPGRPWSGPGPLPARGEDWLASGAEVSESLDGVGGVPALQPLGGGLGLPSCGPLGIEFDQDDVAIGYPSTVDDLDLVGHALFSWLIRN